MIEMFCHFVLLYQNKSTLSSGLSWSAIQFPGNYALLLASFFTYQKLLPNLVNSTAVAGCGELSMRFEPTRNGEIFWMNNNKYYLALRQKLKINKQCTLLYYSWNKTRHTILIIFYNLYFLKLHVCENFISAFADGTGRICISRLPWCTWSKG